MLSFDNFTYWNKLDIKTQATNPFESKFPSIDRKIRKKILQRYSIILSTNP